MWVSLHAEKRTGKIVARFERAINELGVKTGKIVARRVGASILAERFLRPAAPRHAVPRNRLRWRSLAKFRGLVTAGRPHYRKPSSVTMSGIGPKGVFF
jgi:predicted urease superfamily metal-dependent hydrolase